MLAHSLRLLDAEELPGLNEGVRDGDLDGSGVAGNAGEESCPGAGDNVKGAYDVVGMSRCRVEAQLQVVAEPEGGGNAQCEWRRNHVLREQALRAVGERRLEGDRITGQARAGKAQTGDGFAPKRVTHGDDFYQLSGGLI